MKFVAFDLDDTLYKEIDYVQSAYDAIILVMVERGVEKEVIQAIINDALGQGENVFDAILGVYSNLIGIDELLNVYRYHKPKIELPIESKQLLDRLHNKVIMGIITDGRSLSQRNKIESLGLNEYICEADIIISEELGSEKTDASNFSFFNDKYNEITDFYYVGDNLKKDFYNPNQLNWTTIQLIDDGRNIHSQEIDVTERYKAKYRISSILEVCDIIFEKRN